MSVCRGVCLSVSICPGWYGLYQPCRLGLLWTEQEEGEIRFPLGKMEGRWGGWRGKWKRRVYEEAKCKQNAKQKPGKIRQKCDIRRQGRSSERWETARYRGRGEADKGGKCGQMREWGVRVVGNLCCIVPKLGELEGLSHLSISNVPQPFIPNFGSKD